MGAHFRHPAFSSTWSELDVFRGRQEMALYATDAAGEPVEAAGRPQRLALVVGNEGAGISAEARARADRAVALPLRGGVESLNVAVATGILLYQFRR
jgi:tRNA G18 (ribose-2'-O)-methylase SpoU